MVPAKTVHIGVFLPTGAQLLDFSCVDIFGTMSKEYMSIVAGTAEPTGAAHATTDTSATIGPLLPASVAAAAPPVRIYYITEHGPSGPLAVGDAAAAAMRANGTMDADKSMGHVQMTSSIQLRATHAITDAAVQPGALDILLVPGPDPRDTWNDAVLAFLRAHADATGADGKTKRTDILSVCTGILLCGAAGLLDGRTCTGPRGLQGQLKRLFPKAMFVGDKLRWVRDGNFWSCGKLVFLSAPRWWCSCLIRACSERSGDPWSGPGAFPQPTCCGFYISTVPFPRGFYTSPLTTGTC